MKVLCTILFVAVLLSFTGCGENAELEKARQEAAIEKIQVQQAQAEIVTDKERVMNESLPAPNTSADQRANSTPNTVDTGAYGQIMAERSVGPTASRSPYVGGIIVKLRSTNKEYTRFQTDAQGNYNITLSAGTYYFIPADGNWPWATDPKYERDIVVKNGAYTRADLSFISTPTQ